MAKNEKFEENIIFVNKVKLKQTFANQLGVNERVGDELHIFHYFYLPPAVEVSKILKRSILARLIFFEGLA